MRLHKNKTAKQKEKRLRLSECIRASQEDMHTIRFVHSKSHNSHNKEVFSKIKGRLNYYRHIYPKRRFEII